MTRSGSDSADRATGSDRPSRSNNAEKPSATSSQRDASDSDTKPTRAQRKAAKRNGDDTGSSSAKSDDRNSPASRSRQDNSSTSRDTKGHAPDTDTARDGNRSTPDGTTARDKRNTPDSNTARDTNRATPDSRSTPDGATARDTNKKSPDSNTARDTNRPTPDSPTARDSNRMAPDRNDARDTTRGTPNNNAAGDNRMRNGDNRVGNRNGGDRGMSPAGTAAIGAAAGFAGGFIAATGAQRLDDIRRDRREVVEDGRTYVREPGRTIITDGDRRFVVHDENERFRDLGYNVQRERRGRDYVDIIDRPGGVQIVTYTDADGRMLRRVRRDRSGHEFVLIDNGVNGSIRPYRDDIVDLPPPPMRLARDRYVVDYRNADETLLYDTLTAPPLAAPPQRYTLDQIRYSPDVRNYVRSVDINTINFDTASWTVPGEATGKLQALAGAINRAVDKNPNSVFLVEGYTDAVGNATDNLSLSDRRAQSVAAILTKSFNVPPENLTTQGYGQQNLKVDTQGPSAENRRVVVRNITQLIASGNQPAPQE